MPEADKAWRVVLHVLKHAHDAMNGNNAFAIEEGSTNVYADLEYPDAAAMQRKSELASGIAHTIQQQGLTLEAAAALAGMEPYALSRITRGQFRDIEEFQLLGLMTRLGHDVTILVGPVKRRPGRIELHFT